MTIVDPVTLAHLKERLAGFDSDDATAYGDVYGLELTRAERNVLRAVLAENERMRAERDDAHRRFDALVHADKAKQGAADWMLNRLHDDRLIDDGTYTSLCGLLRDQIDATRHLTHSEDWGPLTDRFRAAVKRTKDAEAEAGQMRKQFAELADGMTVAVELLDRLANDEECELWPRGCQTHGGYPAPCPHPLARQVVAGWRAVQAEGVSHV
jgi:hypothetical protein